MASRSAISMLVDSLRPTMLCSLVLIVISALWRYFSAERMTFAVVILPRILPIRSMPSSPMAWSGLVTVNCLPVYSICIVLPQSERWPFSGKPDLTSEYASTGRDNFCLITLATLVGTGDAEVFAVLGDGAPGDVDSLGLEDVGEL